MTILGLVSALGIFSLLGSPFLAVVDVAAADDKLPLTFDFSAPLIIAQARVPFVITAWIARDRR